jgi:hypothetical protein
VLQHPYRKLRLRAFPLAILDPRVRHCRFSPTLFQKVLHYTWLKDEYRIAAARICKSLVSPFNVLISKSSHYGVAFHTSSELHPVPLFSSMASLLLTASTLTAFFSKSFSQLRALSTGRLESDYLDTRHGARSTWDVACRN